MLELDEAALNDHFSASIDVDALQVSVENQPAETVDKTRIYCHWRIYAGDSEKTQSDGVRTQLGSAVLRVVAPLETWSDDAKAVRDQFLTAFRDFRSPDKCLTVYKTRIENPKNDNSLIIDCKVFWRSVRKP